MLMLHRYASMIGKEYLPDIFGSLAFLGEIKPDTPLKLPVVSQLVKLVYCALASGYEQSGRAVDVTESEVMDAVLFGDESIGAVVMDVAKLITDYTQELQRISEKKKQPKIVEEVSS